MRRNHLSIASKVERRILRSKNPGIAWTMHSFSDLPPGAVARILSRLCAEGIITRARKGIYYRPVETIFGTSVPNPVTVAEAAAKIKGRKILVSGYTAYNALGLTTQIAGKTTLATDRFICSSSLRNNKVRTVTRPIYSSMEPAERAVLDALRDINRIADTTPKEIIERIRQLISSDRLSFDQLARFAIRGEPPRVRALLGAIGEQIKAPSEILMLLHRTLNVTTIFKIRLDDSLPSAHNWRITA